MDLYLHPAAMPLGRARAPMLLALAWAMACCGPSSPPLMAPSSRGALGAPAPPDQARVVFVQGPFDGWYDDHASIVDEGGRLLGESWPDTWFSVDLPPGEHAFFGWKSDWAGVIPFAHVCTCMATRCTEIAAMRARLLAAKTYYVFLRGVGPGGRSWVGRLEHGSDGVSAFDFLRVSPRLGEWSPSLLKRLRPIAVDATEAARLTATAGGGYEDTIVCMGQKRMQDPEAWDPSQSTLHPADGR